MDWVTQGKDGGKFGKLDKDKIAAAGQSCGGIEALNVSNDKRVKLTGMFNSGQFSAGGDVLKNLNHPIAYFLGGSGDIAYKNVSSSHRSLPLPSDLTTCRENETTRTYQPMCLPSNSTSMVQGMVELMEKSMEGRLAKQRWRSSSSASKQTPKLSR